MNDKLYKALRIIFLTLAIISLVFGFCKKVGLCASGGSVPDDGTIPWELPLPISGDVGTSYELSPALISDIVSDIEDGFTGSDNTYPYQPITVGYLSVGQYDSSNNTLTFNYMQSPVTINYFNFDSNPTSASNFCSFHTDGRYGYVRVDLSNNTRYYINSGTGNNKTLSQGYQMPVSVALPNNTSKWVVPRLTWITNYPVYLEGDSISYNGTVVFQKDTSSGGGDVEDGSGITDITDIIDEYSSDLPQIDDSDPADPSTPLGWLKKILTGIKNLGIYIVSSGAGIINTLRSIAVSILEAINRIYNFISDTIHNLMLAYLDFCNSIITNLPIWIGDIVDWVQDIYNWLYNVLDATLGTLIEHILDILDSIHDFFDKFWHGNSFSIDEILSAITGLPALIYSYFSSFISGFFTNLLATLNDWWEDSDSHLPSWLQELSRIIHNIYTMGIDPEDSDHRFSLVTLLVTLFEFNTNQALTDFSNNKYGAFIISVKSFCADFVTSLTGITASNRVFFTIDLGNVFGDIEGSTIQPITIDFDWYSNPSLTGGRSVRDIFIPVFCAFLYVSCVWLFIKRLPDILRGVAGAESSFIDGLSDDFAPTSHGVFTRGVSHNQPSLDKSPLSGSGGVHSGSSQFWY